MILTKTIEQQDNQTINVNGRTDSKTEAADYNISFYKY